MTTDKIPTAKSILTKNNTNASQSWEYISKEDSEKAMIEFGKICAQAAIKAAADKARITEEDSKPEDDYKYITRYDRQNGVEQSFIVSKDSILNAYDLNQIQ